MSARRLASDAAAVPRTRERGLWGAPSSVWPLCFLAAERPIGDATELAASL